MNKWVIYISKSGYDFILQDDYEHTLQGVLEGLKQMAKNNNLLDDLQDIDCCLGGQLMSDTEVVKWFKLDRDGSASFFSKDFTEEEIALLEKFNLYEV